MSQLFDESQQFFDPDTGVFLVGGKLYIGDPGVDARLNEKSVFDNRELTGSALAQPLILGATGQVPVKAWLSGTYSFIVDSSADVQIDEQLQNGFSETVGNVQTTGSLGVNDIVATGEPTQTSYVDNQQYIVTAPATNTGVMTVQIDTLDVIPLKKGHNQAMIAGDVIIGMKLAMIYNSADDWMELQSSVNIAISTLYPIGAIYLTVVATNPGTLFGFGTWSRIAEGRTLIGEGTGSGLTARTAGAELGVEDAVNVSHTHSVTDPTHTHSINSDNTAGTSSAHVKAGAGATSSAPSTNPASTGISIVSAGVSATDKNMQPSLVVYIWERTA